MDFQPKISIIIVMVSPIPYQFFFQTIIKYLEGSLISNGDLQEEIVVFQTKMHSYSLSLKIKYIELMSKTKIGMRLSTAKKHVRYLDQTSILATMKNLTIISQFQDIDFAYLMELSTSLKKLIHILQEQMLLKLQRLKFIN